MEPIRTARDELETEPLRSDQAVDGVIAFVSKQDTDEPKTVFWIQAVLPPGQTQRLLKAMGFGSRLTFQDYLKREQTAYWKVLEASFSHPKAGWEHFKDSRGNEIPFSMQKLEMIPEHVRNELIDFVKDATFGPE